MLATAIMTFALSLSVAAETWGTYTTIPVSYTTFLALQPSGGSPFVGPKGLYTLLNDLTLAYVDATPSGNFSQDFPVEHADIVAAITSVTHSGMGLDFLSAVPEVLGERATCGNVCPDPSRGKGEVCTSCTCKFYSGICVTPGSCIQIYGCG